MTDILQKINETTFPGAMRFVASENFVVNISENSKMKISYLGNNFPAWLLDKVENEVPLSALICSRLVKNSTDEDIITALGGETKAETFLAEMFHQMSLQPNGEEGILLNNGEVNFFYIRDSSDSLRTIRLLWQNGGWGIHAIRPHDTLNLPVWSEGSYVFSRN